jgi:hypothetical protein
MDLNAFLGQIGIDLLNLKTGGVLGASKAMSAVRAAQAHP